MYNSLELCVHIFTRESPCEEISVDLKRRSTYHFIPFNTQRFFYSFNNNIILKELKRSIESLRACVSGATCCICGMFFFDNFFSLLKFITLSCSAKILNNLDHFDRFLITSTATHGIRPPLCVRPLSTESSVKI